MNRINENIDKIYPWIKVMFSPNENVPNSNIEIKFSYEDSPIKITWLDNLSIFYVIDEGSNFSLILNRDLKGEYDIEQIHEIAIKNLERNIDFRLNKTKFGGFGILAGGDHEAGSICLPEIWAWISNHLNDNLIVSIPAKDLVLIVPESEVEKIDSQIKFTVEIFKDGERLLTKTVFKFDKISKKWSVFKK